MSKIRKKKIKKTNILLGFICILLAVLLGFILVTSYKSEQKESRHLSEIADDQQSGIEDYEAVKNVQKSWRRYLPKKQKIQKTLNQRTQKTQKTQKKRIQLTQKIQKIRRQLLQVLCAGEMI